MAGNTQGMESIIIDMDFNKLHTIERNRRASLTEEQREGEDAIRLAKISKPLIELIKDLGIDKAIASFSHLKGTSDYDLHMKVIEHHVEQINRAQTEKLDEIEDRKRSVNASEDAVKILTESNNTLNRELKIARRRVWIWAPMGAVLLFLSGTLFDLFKQTQTFKELQSTVILKIEEIQKFVK